MIRSSLVADAPATAPNGFGFEGNGGKEEANGLNAFEETEIFMSQSSADHPSTPES